MQARKPACFGSGEPTRDRALRISHGNARSISRAGKNNGKAGEKPEAWHKAPMETKLQAVRTRKTKSAPKWLNYVCTARKVQKKKQKKKKKKKQKKKTTKWMKKKKKWSESTSLVFFLSFFATFSSSVAYCIDGSPRKREYLYITNFLRGLS